MAEKNNGLAGWSGEKENIYRETRESRKRDKVEKGDSGEFNDKGVLGIFFTSSWFFRNYNILGMSNC